MAATHNNSRRSARATTTPTRQGLRSQMRITKNKSTAASEKASVKREVKREVEQEVEREVKRQVKRKVKTEAAATTLSSIPLSSVADVKPSPSPANPPRKSKQTRHITSTPFPDFARPTPADCTLAHDILVSLHGARARPAQVVASRTAAGCGDSPSVLDALVRTILSQNTSSANSTRAKQSMDRVYGGSDRWEAIAAGGQAKLQRAIQSGGLAATKSRVIVDMLAAVRARYGVYSLDHLFTAGDAEAMEELLAFPGVGPKTASCILLFCLQRPSFAVDTHVYRLTGVLGWRPHEATREQAQAHLDAKVPDELKYPLHVLLIAHGRTCSACNAKAAAGQTCKLREAFE
ncbi:HhH-GPD family base excision DNA repair protein [Beauveria brongniartii RCEF 3172]|uniref:HhH-GPD family base excision DNA repair protein n=1 Tax=Beauveria brongniartii RCEF 3172 TaxID=1081107 RepID=A0A162HSY4_9HYPO|nr:HhH-GPD family base excision DNA repair protein [Beauveria brongniartii RCEF 3172]